MIKEIVLDKEILSIRCFTLSKNEIETGLTDKIVKDLLDTANAHSKNCTGIAANQIGYNKRAIIVKINKSFVAMINPQIIACYGGYKKEKESCLSFPGEWVKKRRNKKVKLSYYDPINKVQVPCLKLKAIEARAFQHEMDHLNGHLI